MRIVADGDRAKLPAGVREVLTEGAMPNPLDAHAVQPLYAALIAKEAGIGDHGDAGREPRDPRRPTDNVKFRRRSFKPAPDRGEGYLIMAFDLGSNSRLLGIPLDPACTVSAADQ